MKAVQDDIYRPMLELKKSEILKYVESENIVYYEDRSNACNDYTRNFIRNEVVSRFENIHPEYRRNISKLLEYLDTVQTYLETEVQRFL